MHSNHHDAHKTAAFSFFKCIKMCANIWKIIESKIKKNSANVILNYAKQFPVKNIHNSMEENRL